MAWIDLQVQSYSLWIGVGMAVLITGRLFASKLWKRIQHSVYARMIDKVMKNMNRLVAKDKKELFAELELLNNRIVDRPMKILEIGAGSGMNFKYYPKNSTVVCIEPKSTAFNALLRGNAAQYDLNVIGPVDCFAEDMTSCVPSDSVDVVVSTHVLCSVSNVNQCLAEIRRVLRKGGLFIYMEHTGAERGTVLYYIQLLLNPAWRFFADNCHLTRALWHDVSNASFSNVKQTQFRVRNKLPFKCISPHLKGIAIK